ncbi:radical SAM protein [Streptomyces sp. NPDC056464]|uniref:radical SAM protein n=1 Tax=Streptomyces sp. NPDC056464 TaxID=3345828 RepID=UPI0036CB0CA3
MHELVVTPFGGRRLILRPGSSKAVQLPHAKFDELSTLAASASTVPQWLVDAVRAQWRLDLAGRSAGEVLLVREAAPYGYSRATWEINLGCDYDCALCYLGEKRFEGLDRAGKRKLLTVMREAGVIWLQITGGEPLIDPDFFDAYQFAHEVGLILEVLSNGSRLHKDHVRERLVANPPAKLTLSVYGATAETYDAVTRRRGAFKRFREGLEKAVRDGLNIDLSLIIVRQNEHEVEAMQDWARRLGVPFGVALFTSCVVSCSRVWEAPRSTVG